MDRGRRKSARIDIAAIRREQIIAAATAVIAERGLHQLSLSAIEAKVRMSRGQLMYYFKTKEAILLAVFDRLLERMCQEHGRVDARGDPDGWMPGWEEMLRNILGGILDRPTPEFRCLQFTFLAQVGHRADFRRRLATLYEDWRRHLTEQFRAEWKKRPPARRVSPRALASVVQALLHGVAIQAAVDPAAFGHREITDLCVDLVGNYLWPNSKSEIRNPKQIRNSKKNNRKQLAVNFHVKR